MTDKFIQAWCEEHDFSDKVAAVIAYKKIEEKDLNVDNYCEDNEEIIIDNESYTVYSESDVYDMIDDEQDNIKYDIKNQLRRYIPDYDIFDYIDFKEYFDNYGVDVSDVIDENRFTEFCFNNRYFYICDNDQY
jgi:hypothetical protein